MLVVNYDDVHDDEDNVDDENYVTDEVGGGSGDAVGVQAASLPDPADEKSYLAEYLLEFRPINVDELTN